MLKKYFYHTAALCVVLCAHNAGAINLTAGQEDFITTGDITTSSSGIISSLAGSSGDLNSITNLHTITTGSNGATSSAYGIRVNSAFNQVTNSTSGVINTTDSSGRGISISDSSIAINQGAISTLSTSSYGIYAGGNENIINNSGIIQTAQSYGIYLDGNANQLSNSGTITTSGGTSAYGIYISAGSDLAASEIYYSEVENSGNINSQDHGIYNKDNFAQITNSGTITPLNDAAINGIRNEADEVTITNSGTINSARYAIYNSGQEVTINNSGTLGGSEIRLGNATLNILGGSILGKINGNNEARVNIGSNLVNVDYTQENIFEDVSSLTINSNSSFSTNSTLEVQTIFVAQNGTLNLNNGTNLESATIRSLTNNAGNVNLSGINFSGNLGISGAALENINIESNSSFSPSGDIFADNISIAGNLNFNHAATIHGNLTVASAGNFNIANNNQIISGNFILENSGILQTNLAENTLGNLQILGDSTIENGAKLSLNFSNNDYIENGTRFLIISSDGTNDLAEISPQNISINNNSSNIYGLLRFTTIATDDNIYLEANHLAAHEISQNQNTQNIYLAISEIGSASSGNLRQFQTFLDNSGLSADALDLAINQAAPFPTKASILTTTNIVNNNIKIDEKRLDKTRFNEEVANGFWVEGFGNNLTQDQVKNDDGFSANSVGAIVGFDREYEQDGRIGASISYTMSNIKTSDDSKSNLISTYQVGIFNTQKFNKYFLDLIGTFAFHQYSHQRSITAIDSEAKARYNGQTYAAKIKFGKVEDLKFDLKFIPHISLNLIHSAIDGYEEKGAETMNLSTKAITANYLEARVGADFGWVTRIPDLNEFKHFALLLKTSVGQNIINDKPDTITSFSCNNQNFTQKISELDATSLRVGFEIDAYHEDDIAFALEAGVEKRASLQSSFVTAKVRQAF